MEHIKKIRDTLMNYAINFTYKKKGNEHKFDFMFISLRSTGLSANADLFAKYVAAENYNCEYASIVPAQPKYRLLMDYLRVVRLMKYAKVVVLDDFFYPLNMLKKTHDDQEFIQLWHALGCFKRVGNKSKHLNYDHVFVNNPDDIKHYREVFKSKHYYGLGMLRVNLYNKLELDIENHQRKRVLYAPTYRDVGKELIVKEWIQLICELSESYELTVSLHPYVSKLDIIDYIPDNVCIVQDEEKVLKSLNTYDLLITDYSSLIFDFSYFEQPIIHFVPDLETYRATVNFFNEIESFDLSICTSVDDVKAVLSNDQELARCKAAVKVLKRNTFMNQPNVEREMISKLNI